MLVLSRRLNEKILFPTMQTTIEVVAVKHGVVRLGITAPPDVTVLREELCARPAECTSPVRPTELPLPSDVPKLKELLRNRLHIACVGFGVLNRQLQVGSIQDAKVTVSKLSEDVQSLLQRLESEIPKPPPPASPSPRKSKALLVEDNPNECRLLATFLRMSGVDVDTAGDGSDALDYLRSHDRPDVVLLDMGLPRCDGATMVREIRRNPAHAGLRIFAVTGHSEDEFNLECGPGGVDRWFYKPIDPLSLVRDLNQELAGSPRRL